MGLCCLLCYGSVSRERKAVPVHERQRAPPLHGMCCSPSRGSFLIVPNPHRTSFSSPVGQISRNAACCFNSAPHFDICTRRVLLALNCLITPPPYPLAQHHTPKDPDILSFFTLSTAASSMYSILYFLSYVQEQCTGHFGFLCRWCHFTGRKTHWTLTIKLIF